MSVCVCVCVRVCGRVRCVGVAKVCGTGVQGTGNRWEG